MEFFLSLLVFDEIWVVLDKFIKIVLVWEQVDWFAVWTGQKLDETALDFSEVWGDPDFLFPQSLEGFFEICDVEFTRVLPFF